MAHLPRFLLGLLNLHLLALLPPVCPASCNLSLFIYPPREKIMPTSLDQLLRYCQETHGNSASLSEISTKKKRKEKKLHAGCRCSVRHQRKKASRASRHRPPASLPTHVLIMSPCLQLRKHTSASYSTLCDWDLAGSQPLENGSRSCHKRKSDGGLRGDFSRCR